MPPIMPASRIARLRPIFSYLRPYRPQLAGAAVALVLSSLLVLLLGQGLRHIVDQGLRAGDAQLLNRTVAAFVGVVLLLAVATGMRFYLVSWIGEKVVADLRNAAFRRVVALSPAYFETTRTGDVLSRLTTDTELLQTVIGSSLSLALRNTLTLAGAIVMLAVTSPKLTGIVLVVVPAVVAPIVLFGRRVRVLSRKSQDRVGDIGAYVEETINAIRTVQSFTHENEDRVRFAGRVADTLEAATARIRMRSLLMSIVILLAFGAVAVVLWVGGFDVIAGRMTGGALSAFVFYAILVAVSGGTVSEVIGDLQRAAGAAERLLELMETEPTVSAPADPTPMPSPPLGEVSFRAVGFRYPSRPDHAAIDDFTLSVHPGETVALVGPSGAGKSTAFQLLLRFYDPDEGQVLIDGVDIRMADPAEVRRRVGLVSQDPVIFGTSARENIRYGRPEASDEDVRAAAEAAAASDFLDALPEGFDTFLGEKGVRLSGGQRQRVAIARAILRNPSILLLDEATSALDAESERSVQKAIEKLAVGRTTIVIAHRLATVLKADRIVVIDQGRIVAEGTHDQLIAAGGLYARLAALQFTDGGGDGRSARGSRDIT